MMQSESETKPLQVAIVESDSGPLAVLPAKQYRTFERELTQARTELAQAKNNHLGWIILSVCAGASMLTAAIGFVLSQGRTPMAAAPAPAPLVVEKPVVVDRNCILFCSK